MCFFGFSKKTRSAQYNIIDFLAHTHIEKKKKKPSSLPAFIFLLLIRIISNRYHCADSLALYNLKSTIETN